MTLPARFALSAFALGTALSSTVGLAPVQAAASLFTEAAVPQDSFLVMAAPRANNAYNLVVIEQKPNQRACWQEKNTAAGTVDPLLLNFDFSGICGRSTDSNGYSIRMAGEDLGLSYSLRLENRGSYVALLGTPSNRRQTELEIGRTKGIAQDYLAVQLNPGWELSRRIYDGKPLGHVYFTSPVALANTIAQKPTPKPPVAATPAPAPAPKPPVAATPAPQPTQPPVVVGNPLPTPPVAQKPVAQKPVEQKPIIIEVVPVTEPTKPVASTPKPPAATVSATEQKNPHYEALNALYSDILGRTVDPSGLATYSRQLEKGKTLAWVRDRLLNSQEGRTVAINRVYRQVLGRDADHSGLKTYMRRMEKNGWSIAQVQQDLSSSKEAQARLAQK